MVILALRSALVFMTCALPLRGYRRCLTSSASRNDGVIVIFWFQLPTYAAACRRSDQIYEAELMKECSKSKMRRLSQPNFVNRHFIGEGIDIGGGPDPLAVYL
jgi:hypothetical protein